jgi:heme-degrading monooxygenase HmoA
MRVLLGGAVRRITIAGQDARLAHDDVADMPALRRSPKHSQLMKRASATFPNARFVDRRLLSQQIEESTMFAVIFQVVPKQELGTNTDLAKLLKPGIEIDGFIDNERFASQLRRGRLLSVSTWRDEKAVIRWRTLAAHHGPGEGSLRGVPGLPPAVGEFTADNRSRLTKLRQQPYGRNRNRDAKVSPSANYRRPPRRLQPQIWRPISACRIRRRGLLDRRYASIYNPGKRCCSVRGATPSWRCMPPTAARRCATARFGWSAITACSTPGSAAILSGCRGPVAAEDRPSLAAEDLPRGPELPRGSARKRASTPGPSWILPLARALHAS